MAEADPVPSISDASIPEPGRYFNRELSWLNFNQRVLEEASNPAHPLLERLRFLSISGNNLDEFFMVRVAGLKEQQLQGVELRSVDGLTPAQQLEAIGARADALMAEQQSVWHDLWAALRSAGINVIGTEQVDGKAEAWLREHFLEQVFPIITPQALDPAHPFPFIPNKGLGLFFDLVRESDKQVVQELVILPATLPRFIRMPGRTARYIAMESLVRRFTDLLFPGFIVRESGLFRILRDSDIEIEEEAEDLVRYYRSAIKQRRRGRIIRLEMERGVAEPVENMLQTLMQGHEAMSVDIDGFVGITDLAELVEEDRPDLKFTAYVPRFPERIREYGGDCFAAIKAKDIIVHHPYESFDVVIAFLKQAAADPDVVAIKQTLYRAGKQSAIIRALIDAGRCRQVGHGDRRAQGALRRGAEPAVGQPARAGRRAGGLRLHRVEDARQDIHGRPSRRHRLPHLLPLRHRQLSSGHSPHLHGSQLLHGRSTRRARCSRGVQLHHGLCRTQVDGTAHLVAAQSAAEAD
ncbi:polyphosphate kinase 1 [Sphingobium sp. B1D3A]|uniref:ATP-polyphosphate phosphotransferase n=1 Tax=Sphingobium lignivorans TaxID=2735886 RepID=A0ABR6NE57_9SPHN|nr:polyphosphate kinase 1 [Sphingobium lignivorans]